MAGNSDVWIVVPAHNEEQTISQVLSRLTELSHNVVVVDDGSTDHTAGEVLKFPVTHIRHVCNLGQGAALQTGIDYVLRLPQARYILTFDSDGQHDSDDIPRLLEPLRSGAYDVVLGSRWLEGGAAIGIATPRRVLLRLALILTGLSTGLDITDTHNGLRAFTSAAAAKIHITQNRMAHASEILAQIAALKLRYCEVPVKITYTSYASAKGQSMLDSVSILWDMVSGKVK